MSSARVHETTNNKRKLIRTVKRNFMEDLSRQVRITLCVLSVRMMDKINLIAKLVYHNWDKIQQFFVDA